MKSKAWTEKFMQGVFFVAACASVLAVLSSVSFYSLTASLQLKKSDL